MANQKNNSEKDYKVNIPGSNNDNQGNVYKPSPNEEYMCARHLKYFRSKLENWRSDLCHESIKTVETLQNEELHGPELGEVATREADTSYLLRTRDRYRKLIKKIDSAIQRIEDGSYGYCDETGEPIGLRRLDARPIATLSIEAQELHEKYEKSHKDD